MCKVNRSSYYDWLKSKETVKAVKNNQPLTEIRAIFTMSRETYGAIRMTWTRCIDSPPNGLKAFAEVLCPISALSKMRLLLSPA